MSVLRQDFAAGPVSVDISAGATTHTMASWAQLPVVAAPDVLKVTLDAGGVGGPGEIVYVTAHAAASTTVTLARGKEGTTARAHLAATGESWANARTAADDAAAAVWLRKSGDPTADTATLQQAINAGTPVCLTEVWTLNSPLVYAGVNDFVFYGLGGAKLYNNTTDLFTVSGSCARNKFRDIGLETGASGGHLFNAAGTASCSYWDYDGVIFTTAAVTKGAWSQPASGSGSGDHIGFTVRNFTFNQAPTATQPMWKVVNDAGGLNNNTFGPGVTNCRGVYPFWLESSAAGTWAYDNTFEKIVWEVPTNGCVKAISTNNLLVEQCSVWDLQIGAAAAAHLYSLTTGAGGVPTRYAKFRGCQRRGGTLAAGIADIYANATVSTEIDCVDTAVLTGFKVDALNSSQMVVRNSGAVGATGITWVNKPADTYEIGGNQDGIPTWRTWTPVIGNIGAGTNWSLGNGTLTGRYIKIGRTIHWTAVLTLGTTSVAGTNQLTLSLPVAASAAHHEDPIIGQAVEQGVNAFVLSGGWISTTVVIPQTIGASGVLGAVTATTPFTWNGARADQVYLSGTYEAA